jgi:hypothetical protein
VERLFEEREAPGRTRPALTYKAPSTSFTSLCSSVSFLTPKPSRLATSFPFFNLASSTRTACTVVSHYRCYLSDSCLDALHPETLELVN